MDKILSGEKKVEYKSFNKYWQKRIGKPTSEIFYHPITIYKPHKVIHFLCGRKSYKYEINFISIDFTPKELYNNLINTVFCYHIHLGERIGE